MSMAVILSLCSALLTADPISWAHSWHVAPAPGAVASTSQGTAAVLSAAPVVTNVGIFGGGALFCGILAGIGSGARNALRYRVLPAI
jgi:hypothetical protein